MPYHPYRERHIGQSVGICVTGKRKLRPDCNLIED